MVRSLNGELIPAYKAFDPIKYPAEHEMAFEGLGSDDNVESDTSYEDSLHEGEDCDPEDNCTCVAEDRAEREVQREIVGAAAEPDETGVCRYCKQSYRIHDDGACVDYHSGLLLLPVFTSACACGL